MFHELRFTLDQRTLDLTQLVLDLAAVMDQVGPCPAGPLGCLDDRVEQGIAALVLVAHRLDDSRLQQAL